MPSEIERLLAKYPNPKSVNNAPMLERKGNYLREASPELYGFLGGAMGTAPDEFEGSVLDPNSARVALGAKYGFPIGTLAQMLPFVGGVAAGKGAVRGTRGAQRGVIKGPGGNWLSGSVEDSVKGLKRGKFGFSEPYTKEQLAELEQYALENPARAGSTLESLGTTELADMREKVAMNQWVDKQLTRYIKNQMATPEDPVRALAERGVLHYTPQMQTNPAPRRLYAGFPEKGFGNSDLAKAYEGSVDRAVGQGKAGNYLSDYSIDGSGVAEKRITDNPWLAKVPPETRVYSADGSADLKRLGGFDHLIDELRNATNPASGLPPELLLKYSSLPQVSVPQAVERVSQINAWRAAQKAEADLKRANNAATHLHKEYPEGMRWVELKQPNIEAPDMTSNPGYDMLRDALKYEGDTMGHCVGGYCDKVADGSTRIFSLRDKKGQPHVTIETRPNETSAYNRWLAAQEDPKAYKEFTDWWSANTEPGQLGDLNPAFARWAKEKGVEIPEDVPRILQIKGKANRKPNDEYLPFVQDFVRSGKWSDVGDFQNAGLIKRSNLLQREQELMPELGDYLTLEEIQGMRKGQPWTPIDTDPEFAEGGLVRTNDYNPERVNQLVAQLKEELYA
jgi:hypothetical protein